MSDVPFEKTICRLVPKHVDDAHTQFMSMTGQQGHRLKIFNLFEYDMSECIDECKKVFPENGFEIFALFFNDDMIELLLCSKELSAECASLCTHKIINILKSRKNEQELGSDLI